MKINKESEIQKKTEKKERIERTLWKRKRKSEAEPYPWGRTNRPGWPAWRPNWSPAAWRKSAEMNTPSVSPTPSVPPHHHFSLHLSLSFSPPPTSLHSDRGTASPSLSPCCSALTLCPWGLWVLLQCVKEKRQGERAASKRTGAADWLCDLRKGARL